MRYLFILFIFFLAMPALAADLVYLINGQVLKGEIQRVGFDVVDIKTDMGRQIIQRSAITHIVFDQDKMESLPLYTPAKKKRPLYLLPIAAATIIFSIDAFRDVQDISAQIDYYEYWNAHTSSPYYVDTDRLRRDRSREKLLGYTGLALSAVLVGFVIWDVTVIPSPNQVQLSYRF